MRWAGQSVIQESYEYRIESEYNSNSWLYPVLNAANMTSAAAITSNLYIKCSSTSDMWPAEGKNSLGHFLGPESVNLV